MGRWGRCDYRELKKLDERLQQLSEVDMDRLCRDAAKKVAQILLNKVKKRTPVGVVPSYATDEAKQEYWAGYSGGSLRDAWTILPIEKHGDQYTVTIINNLEYASYVEYGHRQTPGRYVPALGKTLKASWVKGRFMLTISEQEVKTLAPSILNDTINLSFDLYYQREWSWDDVSAYVTEAINGYFLELAQSWADQNEALVVRISQVESRLLGITGILDIANTKINGEAANCTLTLDHIPVLGTIEPGTIVING